MRNKIISTYHRLLNSVDHSTHRYLYDQLNLNSRLTGLIGPRGTGKTTLMLQYINEKMKHCDQCMYAALDNILFSSISLMDFVEEFYEVEGVRYFFFDEIHKYQNWNQELKNLYDSYPDIKIVFSGSSSLDLTKGTYDLSRRGVIFRIGGMSFREYLYFKEGKHFNPLDFQQIIDGRGVALREILSFPKIRGHFEEYLDYGYYPFVFEDKTTYHKKILNIIDKTVFDDIANFYALKTDNLPNFKKIISYMATIPPGELNRNSISRKIGLDNKTVQNYLHILQETGLIRLIREGKSGGNLLKTTEKIYHDNPNLYKAIVDEIGYDYKKGTVRELFFITMIENSGRKLFYSKIGDFTVDGLNFEIGGKSKSKKQIKTNLATSYLVKDDILYGGKHEIPLFLFGFLY
ncbi:MAG: ATP-binding protein [Deltaproteobacteria bacterium]|nr:ATP-binding protein [Deltaproteobacteria bacterium]